MKTTIYFTLFLLLFGVHASAQKQFGLIGGIGQSDMDNYRNYKIFIKHGIVDASVVQNSFSKHSSWKIGAYYNQTLPIKHLSSEFELVFKSMGASYYFVPNEGSDYDTIVYSGVYKMRYFSVPLQLKYNVQDYWYLKAGIAANMHIKNKEYNFQDARLCELGASLAFGLTLFPKLDLILEGYHGLTRINKIAEEDGYDYRLFNSSITLSLKYELWKGK